MAKKINALSPASVKMIKQNLQFSMEETYEKSMAKEVKCQRILGQSNNYKEGLQAFFEKRGSVFERLKRNNFYKQGASHSKNKSIW